MKSTDQSTVNVSYPTPFAVWGKDLQNTDGLLRRIVTLPTSGMIHGVVRLFCAASTAYLCGPLARRSFSSSSSVRL